MRIGFTGDVMIGRTVDPVIGKEGYRYAWGNVLPLLRGTDINIINLETTLTTSDQKAAKVFNFKASPDKVNSLQEAGITVANIANNHILDFCEAGLLDTLHALEGANIKYTGAGRNEREASMPVILEKAGISIGIVGCTDNEPVWKAGPSNSGVNFVDISDKGDCARMLKAVGELQRKTDLTIVSIHWGPNMQEAPADNFVLFAHAMIERGADIIHGHSAHIFQGVEVYHKGLILYDTGDFVDDYAVDPVLRNDRSFFFVVEVSHGRMQALELTPVLISNYQVNLARGDDFAWSMNRIKNLSGSFGTTISDEGRLEI